MNSVGAIQRFGNEDRGFGTGKSETVGGGRDGIKWCVKTSALGFFYTAHTARNYVTGYVLVMASTRP